MHSLVYSIGVLLVVLIVLIQQPRRPRKNQSEVELHGPGPSKNLIDPVPLLVLKDDSQCPDIEECKRVDSSPYCACPKGEHAECPIRKKD